jgi:hypothetical protein
LSPQTSLIPTAGNSSALLAVVRILRGTYRSLPNVQPIIATVVDFLDAQPVYNLHIEASID